MRNVGVGLIVAVYAFLLFTSSYAPAIRSDTGIIATRAITTWAHARLDPEMITVSIAGIALAMIPVRRGERWARWTTLMMLIMVLETRFNTSGQRLAVLDPNQHSYSLMIVSALAVAGLVLTQTFPRGERPPHNLE